MAWAIAVAVHEDLQGRSIMRLVGVVQHLCTACAGGCATSQCQRLSLRSQSCMKIARHKRSALGICCDAGLAKAPSPLQDAKLILFDKDRCGVSYVSAYYNTTSATIASAASS